MMNNIKKQRDTFMILKKRDRRNQLLRIRTLYPYITNEECIQALTMCEQDEDSVVKQLIDANTCVDFLRQIRKEIAIMNASVKCAIKPKASSNVDLNSSVETSESNSEHSSSSEECESDRKVSSESEDEDFKPEPTTKTKSTKKKVTTKTPVTKCTRKRTTKKEEPLDDQREYKGMHLVAKLTLNDAMSDTVSMKGWSEARKNAFKKIKDKPNTYYYRFNKPGEEQRNGKWTPSERKMFFDRLKEFKLDTKKPQWGLFSQTIPGRVGYQCSNFYRQLVSKGEIKDDTYGVDENGQMYWKVKSRKRKSSEDDSPRPRKKKNNTASYEMEWESDAETDDEVEDGSDNQLDTLNRKSSLRTYNNPLAGSKDAITGGDIVDPYLSKYGHVLSYKTWVKVLTENVTKKEQCPFTKQTLMMRDLTKLTVDNIEKYRDLIKTAL
ncbi:hypothetical protein AKO1_006094 [Acrasis kona]|uniref:Myb-like domain-containing protein n=1 Tax=Acrasis kona TaxID=1008807 RepID=A0AAW2YHT2_9EUKA